MAFFNVMQTLAILIPFLKTDLLIPSEWTKNKKKKVLAG